MAAEKARVEEKTVNTSGRPSRRRDEAVAVRRATVPVADEQAEQLQRHRACTALVQIVCMLGDTAAVHIQWR